VLKRALDGGNAIEVFWGFQVAKKKKIELRECFLPI